jgi:hexosaminidase
VANARSILLRVTAIRICLALLSSLFVAEAAFAATTAHPPLIPLPASIEWHGGSVAIGPGTIVEASGGALSTATYLVQTMNLKFGGRGSSHIRLSLVPASRIAGPEAYRLKASGNEILIEASDPRGLFYGVETLRQLVTGPKGSRVVPDVDISDAPRFRWRGLLIDLGRHFFGKPVLYEIIDEMADYKLNTLHLHLTDDPGWRIEIPGYPKLTQSEVKPDGSKEYFTAEDIREIVAYAAERHISVVPEIEMPSHSGSAGSAYPELYNGGSALDPANPETYAFIHAVFGEVAKLFPDPYIHFGGDEVGDDVWKDVKDVRQLKAEKNLRTTKEVEAYFVRNVVEIIKSVGKRPMAWDEQAEAGASKDVTIEWWRTARPDVLNEAAERGSELVMSPVDRLYFDYHQGPGEPGAPWEGNQGGPTSIAKILAWNPVPDNFTPDEAARVLGIEGSVWTEFIETKRYLEFMTFPRLLALAEVAWCPKGRRDDSEFEERLAPHIEALRAKGIDSRRDEGDAYEFITH